MSTSETYRSSQDLRRELSFWGFEILDRLVKFFDQPLLRINTFLCLIIVITKKKQQSQDLYQTRNRVEVYLRVPDSSNDNVFSPIQYLLVDVVVKR